MKRVVQAAIGATLLSFGLGLLSASALAADTKKGKEEPALEKPTIADVFKKIPKPGVVPNTTPKVLVEALQQAAREECAKQKDAYHADAKTGGASCGDDAAEAIYDELFIAPPNGHLVSLEDVTVGMDNVTGVLRHVAGTTKTYYVYTGSTQGIKSKKDLDSLNGLSLVGVSVVHPDFNATYAKIATKLGAPKTQADGSFWFETNGGGYIVLRRSPWGEGDAFIQLHTRTPSTQKKSSDVDVSVAGAMERAPTPAPSASGKKPPTKK